MVEKLLTEQLRPTRLEQAVLLPRIKEELEKGLIDNLLFYGPAGTGKCLGKNEKIDIVFTKRCDADNFYNMYPDYMFMTFPTEKEEENRRIEYTVFYKVKISDLFKFLDLDNEKYEEIQYPGKRRLSGKVLIHVPGNFSSYPKFKEIKAFVKKRTEMIRSIYECEGEEISLECAKKHLIMNKNLTFGYAEEEIQVVDSIWKIWTKKSQEDLGIDDAYDIAIDDPHIYCTSNGLVHHNTTLSKIMSNGHETLEINASLERGIETIRDKVISFASSSSLLSINDSKLKVVLLEECDNLTYDAWASLRSTIERFHTTTRFIGNCNYIEKIPDPIKSRFNCIPVLPVSREEENILMKGYMERMKKILEFAKIQYTEETLTSFVSSNFPDMRTLIKKVQQMMTRGVTSLDKGMSEDGFSSNELFSILLSQGNPYANYDYVMKEWSSKPEEGVLLIGKEFPMYLRKNCPQKENKLPLIIIAIAEHNEQLNRVTDKVITLLSLIFKIQVILNS